jgi:hypothetical protein
MMARVLGWKRETRTKYKTQWNNIKVPVKVMTERSKSNWQVKQQSLMQEKELVKTGTRSEAEIFALNFMRQHPEGL